MADPWTAKEATAVPAVTPVAAASSFGSSSSSEHDSDAAPNNNNTHNMLQEIRRKAQHWWHHEFSVCNLVDPHKPWILVHGGSFLQGFDWVPVEFRVGPWHPLVCLYLCGLGYSVGLLTVYYGSVVPTTTDGHSCTITDSFDAYSLYWWYNLAGLLWTLFVTWSILFQGGGIASWLTFTVQSWTLITLRCFLAVLAPFTQTAARFGEYLRLPMLSQATITFVAWNFLLQPIIYSRMDTPEKRNRFIGIFTNFRLTQLHVFNIVFAALQGIWGTPKRALVEMDGIRSCLFVLGYAVLYLGVLDRLGIHLYLVYSPRTLLAIITWTMTYVALFGCYRLWRYFILEYGVEVAAMQ